MKIGAFLLLVFLATNSPVKPDRKGGQTNSAGDGEREPSVVVVNNQTSAPDTEHGENKTPKWDASVWAVVANWALVGVGLVTFFAVYYQARKTAEATQAMRDSLPHQERAAQAAKDSADATLRSVKLQEIQLQQWVDLVEWQFFRTGAVDGVTEAYITVAFHVLNPTRMPLKLKNIANTISVVWVLPKQFGAIGLTHTLAPDNTYLVEIPFPIKGETLAHFKASQTISLAISSTITFEDVWGTTKNQTFGYSCDCNRQGHASFKVFQATMHEQPKTKDKEAN